MNSVVVAEAMAGHWPEYDDEDAWEELGNTAFQLECMRADILENREWAKQMRALVAEELDYLAYQDARLAALSARTRARKLTQSRLRYQYGYKLPRRQKLIHRDIRSFFKALAEGDTGAQERTDQP